jgi:hypothetical protein
MSRILLPVLMLAILVCCSVLDAVEYEKNPYRAMAYSALVPGGGQLYTRSYVKAALVIGVQAALISQAVSDHANMDKYNSRLDGSAGSLDLYNLQQRNNYRNNLRSDYWWIGTTLFLSVADSFVDAHLYNFTSEKSRVRLRFEDKLLKLEYTF